MEVTLQQILEARDSRAKLQQRLQQQFHCPVVCFTMNIPGPVKNTPLIRRAFGCGLQILEGQLPGILHKEILDASTGCEAMYAVDEDALQLKRICTAIEDSTPLGRLFDMDVLDVRGNKLDRSLVNGNSRDCIVCGAPGRGCASRRLHTLDELQAAVAKIMETHFLQMDRDTIAALAVQSLLDEVNTTPKPGLVDRRNNGSHKDMDIATFAVSAEALRPYFQACVQIGLETAQFPPEETFVQLRREGLRAEQAMYRATGGVNTHKGAVYTMGVLCGSLGRLWRADAPFADTKQLLKECGKLALVSLKKDFSCITNEPATAGERLYLERGITGIRGEVAAGLPSVFKHSLPVFRRCLSEGYSSNDAGVVALLHLIAEVEDTNLYRRGGVEGAAWAATAAAALLPDPSMEEIEALDEEYIRRNLSPGGCADLLAATYFLHKLEKKTSAD